VKSRLVLIEARRQLAPGVFSLVLEAPGIARQARPGQFLNVKVSEGPDPLLRRPISIADTYDDRVRIVFRVVGRGTALLARRRRGDMLDVLGPLGRPVLRPRNRNVVLCGGGVGVAPLLFLARQLREHNLVVACLGARTRAQHMLMRDFRALGIGVSQATDDGSAGYHGMVTDLATMAVRAVERPLVYACGPKPMLAHLVRRVDPVPVWGYVEERMGCGTGICYCCALPKRSGGYVRFCTEGPVIKLNEVEL
jgi:dihydroorotate dehydrogenase electron transfer subunit